MLLCSRLPILSCDSLSGHQPCHWFNENTSTNATVLIISKYPRCDLYGSLWGDRNVCSVNIVPTCSFILLLLACFFSFSPFQSKDIGVQMHEELVKVTNELYTVSCMSDCSSLCCSCILAPESWADAQTCQAAALKLHPADASSALHRKGILSPSSSRGF